MGQNMSITAIIGRRKQVSKPSRLLALAPELRNRVYEYVFSGEDRLVFIDDTYQLPGILKTCRQNKNEATGMFYSSSVFKTGEIDICNKWLAALPREHISLISDIRVGTSSRKQAVEFYASWMKESFRLSWLGLPPLDIYEASPELLKEAREMLAKLRSKGIESEKCVVKTLVLGQGCEWKWRSVEEGTERELIPAPEYDIAFADLDSQDDEAEVENEDGVEVEGDGEIMVEDDSDPDSWLNQPS